MSVEPIFQFIPSENVFCKFITNRPCFDISKLKHPSKFQRDRKAPGFDKISCSIDVFVANIQWSISFHENFRKSQRKPKISRIWLKVKRFRRNQISSSFQTIGPCLQSLDRESNASDWRSVGKRRKKCANKLSSRETHAMWLIREVNRKGLPINILNCRFLIDFKWFFTFPLVPSPSNPFRFEANGCYKSRKKSTILESFTGNESSFVLQVFPLILLQRFPILGFKHKKGTRFEKLVYEVHHTRYSIVIGQFFCCC